MAKGCSKDLRDRAVSIKEAGDSAREAGLVLDLSASTAVRWIKRWTTTGSIGALPGTGFAGHPSRSATAGHALTFNPDHPMGADQAPVWLRLPSWP